MPPLDAATSGVSVTDGTRERAAGPPAAATSTDAPVVEDGGAVTGEIDDEDGERQAHRDGQRAEDRQFLSAAPGLSQCPAGWAPARTVTASAGSGSDAGVALPDAGGLIPTIISS